jgi:cytosine/adenosine deaminase-related metal-dependent hydrolase
MTDPVGSRTLLRGAIIVTCDAKSRIVRGDILIEKGRITAIGKAKPPSGARVVDVTDRIVLPGLVMAHVHLCQALMRGMADDMPLLEWLKRRIWPLEAAHDARTLRASAELGLAELILAGTTAILDLGTVHGQDVVFDACVRSGIRVVGGNSLMDSGAGVPKRLRQNTKDALLECERLQSTWGAHPSGRIRYAYIPRFILSCTEKLVRGSIERAKSSGVRFHTHAAEHAGERDAVRKILGADDVDILRRWGMRGSFASVAHGVQLTTAQMRRLAADSVAVAHCPSANLKLGSGIARVHAMRAMGIVVGLGPDGAPCNNNLDPWVELRHAALLASAICGPGALPADQVLRMATIDGARLLGLDQDIGSLEVGKRADLIAVRTNGVHVAPAFDPVGTLVYATQARDVEHVFVEGQALVQGGELLSLDAAAAAATARREGKRLMRRARL